MKSEWFSGSCSCWSDEAFPSHLHTLPIAFKGTFRWIILWDVGNIHSGWKCEMLDL